MIVKGKVKVYSHFFKVTQVHPDLYIAVLRRCFQELLEVRYIKTFGKVKKTATKIYASRVNNGEEYRFHINYLPRFKELIKLSPLNEAEIIWEEEQEYTPVSIQVTMPEGVTLRDYQEEAIDYILSEGESKLVTLATGMGKMLSLDALVKVPNNWKPIKELEIGDLLNTPNGDVAEVTEIYDSDGVKPFYNVTFADGRSVACCEDHIWEVWINDHYAAYTTLQLLELIDNNALYIPLVDPTHSADEEIDFPMDPYKVGCKAISSIQELIPDTPFLNASFNQRLKIMQGLLHAGGYFNETTGEFFYTSLYKSLIDEIRALAFSLGCICHLKEDNVLSTLTIIAPIPSLFIGDSIRGLNCKDETYPQAHGLRLQITRIDYLGEKAGRCIVLDHPDKLYITDNYIVTHNTFTALAAGERIGKRILIVVLGRYREKWIEDVLGAYGKKCNFIAPKGLSQLLGLIERAKLGQPIPDVILITTTVLQMYIKEWERHAGREMEGMIPPEEMYQVLGIGLRINDEAHQHFHANFISDLYTHCPKTLYLTATLDSHDKFQNFIYYLMWPMAMRTNFIKMKPYDVTIPMLYYHYRPDRVKCMGVQGYSHIRYEQSIWRHVPSRRQYLDMIGDVVETYFLPVYEKGKKMLIFCALVETCISVAEYLNKRFSDKNWTISKFTANDSKSVIDTNDITVSTLGKSGTALDVAGLVVCLMTTALAEPKANKQAKGRLRDLTKKPGFEHITPTFVYLVGADLEKPMTYHHQKMKLFEPITTAINPCTAPYIIGEPWHEYIRHRTNYHLDEDIKKK